MTIREEQIAVCKKYGVPFFDSPFGLKVGITLDVKNGEYPIHGLRHNPEGDTTGWYIWSGDYSDDPDFFVPLHIEHLNDYCPLIMKYLGLPPGYRFLVAKDYEDVWEDISLVS